VGGRISQRALRRAFAIFLVVMGVVIMARETTRLVSGPKTDKADPARQVD